MTILKVSDYLFTADPRFVAILKSFGVELNGNEHLCSGFKHFPNGWKLTSRSERYTDDYFSGDYESSDDYECELQDLIDNKGRIRAEITPNPNDPLSAPGALWLMTRFSYEYVKIKETVTTVITDSNRIIKVIGWFSKPQNIDQKYLDNSTDYGREAIDWLNEHHPKWRDPTAYWDDE